MTQKTKWFNEKWWISPLNYLDDVNKSYNLPEKVYVRDSTIREGEETPGVYYTLEQKVKIASQTGCNPVEEFSCGRSPIP